MNWPANVFNKPPEIDIRQSIHVSLLPDTRNMLRFICIRKGLSIQEVFEELAQRIIIEDPWMVDLIENLVYKKREKIFEQLSGSDAECLYNIIEAEAKFREKIRKKSR
jgi:hypothetical protein